MNHLVIWTYNLRITGLVEQWHKCLTVNVMVVYLIPIQGNELIFINIFISLAPRQKKPGLKFDLSTHNASKSSAESGEQNILTLCVFWPCYVRDAEWSWFNVSIKKLIYNFFAPVTRQSAVLSFANTQCLHNSAKTEELSILTQKKYIFVQLDCYWYCYNL